MFNDATVAIPALALAALLCQWLAAYVRLPAIFFLLLAGIAVGPVLGWFDPDAVFGSLLFPMVSTAVAIILFEGALSLRLDEIRGVERVVRHMVTTGTLVTWCVTTIAAHYAVGLSWQLSTLFGAVMVVTGPTVIVPMLRTVRPNAKVGNILRWEGIIIDPIGAALAVLVFEFLVSARTSGAWGHILYTFATIIAIGGVFGVAAGWLLGLALRRHWLPDYLHNLGTLATLLVAYTASNHIVHESGLLTVTVMGVWLANMRGVHVHDILHFKENLSVLLISALFMILAARIEFNEMAALGFGALIVVLAMQFVGRPLKVFLATAGSDLSFNEKLVLSWIGPRGIVAAAVSALFALRLQDAGFEGASALVSLTFIVIIGTVVLQGTTARWVATRLGVAEPEPTGFLIIGADDVARAIGRALMEQGKRVLLAESDWEHTRAARMDGMQTYYGNPTSPQADEHINLIGIGRVLALSPNSDLNSLAMLKYRPDFGTSNVFMLRPAPHGYEAGNHHKLAGRALFASDAHYASLSTWLAEGATIKSTLLTENFTFDQYQQTRAGFAMPLFAVNPKGKVHVFAADATFTPGVGWHVVALVRADAPDGVSTVVAERPTSAA